MKRRARGARWRLNMAILSRREDSGRSRSAGALGGTVKHGRGEHNHIPMAAVSWLLILEGVNPWRPRGNMLQARGPGWLSEPRTHRSEVRVCSEGLSSRGDGRLACRLLPATKATG